MAFQRTSAWLMPSLCTVLVAALVPAWMMAPVLDMLSVSVWRSAAVLAAGAIGAVFAWLNGSWGRTVFAVLVGLLAGTVALDLFAPKDVSSSYPALTSLFETLHVMARELACALVAAGTGAMVVRLITRRNQHVSHLPHG